jgi:hypothetical protein
VNRSLGPASRIVAGVLALIGIGAGVTAIGLGSLRRDWRAVGFGVLAAGCGLVWARVARTGRYVGRPSARLRR